MATHYKQYRPYVSAYRPTIANTNQYLPKVAHTDLLVLIQTLPVHSVQYQLSITHTNLLALILTHGG